MQKFLLDRSPTGVEHFAHVSDDELILEEHTPSSVDAAVVDECARLRSLTPNKKAQMRHAGQIPINLYTKWRQEWMAKFRDVWTWKTWLIMKMNSAEFKNLRTGVRRL